MDSEQQITERWAELIDAGVLEADHLDNDGDIIYSINEDNLKEYDPILHQRYRDDWDAQIAGLISGGFMDVYVDEHGEAYFEPTAKCEEWMSALEEVEPPGLNPGSPG